MERRLAAILAADVVGYSSLMSKDEAGTLAALKAHREGIIEPKINEHHGRIVKLMGDGMLAEFASVVEAVQCAVEIQDGMAQHSAEKSDDGRMLLRIGINLGDIIVEDGDIYGDGVNVAARLEGLAEPGGICVQRDVRNQVRDKLPLAFEDLGEVEMKNITRPVRVFRILLRSSMHGDVKPTVGPALKPPPEKPSVVVLPFVNMSGDSGQEYFADGITENIITELGRFRSIFIISRHSSFVYKGRAVNLQTVGRDLGVRYVVEGSVQKAGSRVRVTAQLTEVDSGKHLWAERYDRDLEDIFGVQDELTEMIVACLAGRLDDAERERTLKKTGENLSAYDLVLKGKFVLRRGSREDVFQAREFFLRALELDANHAPAHVWLAESYMRESQSDWAQVPDEAAKRAFELACKAVDLDDRDSWAHLMLAWGYLRVKANFELARSELERAMSLNPNEFYNYCFKSWFLTCSGDPSEGISCANEAIRRNPFLPDGCLETIGFADYLSGRYEQAVSTFGRIVSPPVEVSACIAACQAQLGRHEQARAAAAEFLKRARSELAVFPGQDSRSWRAYWLRQMPFKDDVLLAHLLDGLQKAGLPA